MLACPKCSSSNVVALPPDGISKKPGYRCGQCGLKMRASGLLINLFVLSLGLAFFLICAFFLFTEEFDGFPAKVVILAATGAIVTGYSIAQIIRPVPSRTNEEL